MDAVVYHDANYPTHDVGAHTTVRDYFKDRGFTVKGASDLQTWMQAYIDRGKADGAVCVVAKDAFPDTVYDGTWDCRARKFLEAGGRIVWTGDVPFVRKGNPDGTVTLQGLAAIVLVTGLHLTDPQSTSSASLLDNGLAWGLRYTWTSALRMNGRGPVTELAREANGYPCAWVLYLNDRKVGGLVRVHDNNVAYNNNPGLLEDLYRVAVHSQREVRLVNVP